MNYFWFVMCVRLVLLLVIVGVVFNTMSDKRTHRVGLVLLSCWAVFALGFAVVDVTEPLPIISWRQWIAPCGTMFFSWALWDLTRVLRRYSSSSLVTAAEVARGFIVSDRVDNTAWSLWARNLPVPAWIKSVGGGMISANLQYQCRYGKPSILYAGSLDSDFWHEATAESYGNNDNEVIETGEPAVYEEPAGTHDEPGRHAMFLKFPIRNNRGQVVGVGGLELQEPST